MDVTAWSSFNLARPSHVIILQTGASVRLFVESRQQRSRCEVQIPEQFYLTPHKWRSPAVL